MWCPASVSPSRLRCSRSGCPTWRRRCGDMPACWSAISRTCATSSSPLSAAGYGSCRSVSASAARRRHCGWRWRWRRIRTSPCRAKMLCGVSAITWRAHRESSSAGRMISNRSRRGSRPHLGSQSARSSPRRLLPPPPRRAGPRSSCARRPHPKTCLPWQRRPEC